MTLCAEALPSALAVIGNRERSGLAALRVLLL